MTTTFQVERRNGAGLWETMTTHSDLKLATSLLTDHHRRIRDSATDSIIAHGGGAFIAIAELVSALRTEIPSKGCYPALGAEGGDWFIALATGLAEDRHIHVTLYISPVEGRLSIPNVHHGDEELHVALPEAAHLVGLVALLERATGERCMVLTPLMSDGNHFPEWKRALARVGT